MPCEHVMLNCGKCTAERDEARQQIKRLNAQVLHLCGKLAEYEPAEETAEDLEDHARYDRMTDDEVMGELTSDGVTTREDVEQWCKGVAVFARAALTKNAEIKRLTDQLAAMTAARNELHSMLLDRNDYCKTPQPMCPRECHRAAELRKVGES